MSEKARLIVLDHEASRICELHEAILGQVKTTLESAVEIGQLLSVKKASLAHDEWTPWVKTLPFTHMAAWRYMNLWENRDKLNTVLSLQDAYKLLAGKQHTPVQNGFGHPDEWPEGVIGSLSEVEGQTFGCIYADPPWSYSNQGTRGATNNHYDGTMTVDELCALPIGELAAEKSHLHLWTTNAFLFETPKIFEAWGFEFKSSFVWVKPQMGIGNYWRNSHEFLLLGVRGGLTAQDKSQMSWLEHKRGRHSSKPDRIQDAVEKLSPGPRLELFGRRPRPGWVVFGNQVDML